MTPNRTGNSGGAALHAGEERIEYTLAAEQRVVGCQLLAHRTRLTHRPDLQHAELGLVARKFHLEHDILKTYTLLMRNFGQFFKQKTLLTTKKSFCLQVRFG